MNGELFSTRDLPQPHFAIIGPADDPVCNDILVTLINNGGSPQSWGDRKPPEHLFVKSSNIFFDGKQLVPEHMYKGKWEDLIGIVSYYPRLERNELEELVDYCRWVFFTPARVNDDKMKRMIQSFPKPPKILNKE